MAQQPRRPPAPPVPPQSADDFANDTIPAPRSSPGDSTPSRHPAPSRARDEADESLVDIFESSRPPASSAPPRGTGGESMSDVFESTEQTRVKTRPPAGSSSPTTDFEAHTIPASRPPGSRPPAAAGSNASRGGASGLGEAPTIDPSPASPSRAESAASGAPPAGGKADPHGLVGKTLNGYRIEKLLGAGGMGAVYLAHQIALDRKVAFKILPAKFAGNADLLARFTREALSAAQLTHHNIVQVYDIGCSAEVNYIVMEFVKGQSLGDMIKKEGRFRPDDAAAYVLQASRGLLYAHERGIIHRDIKPDNLMVNEQGIVKIADMGLAKMNKQSEAPASIDMANPELHRQSDDALTMAQVAMGTPAYMAPEQGLDAASVDARADQYSLGCTLYYLCAGKAPYQGTTAYELITKHRNEPLTPIDVHVRAVPEVIKHILEKMLQKDPVKRYPSLIDVIKELEVYLGISSDGGAYKPREQQVAILDVERECYYKASGASLRKLVIPVFFAVMAVAVLYMLLIGRDFAVAGGLVGLAVLTPLFNFIIDGVRNRTYLFRRVRSVFFGMPLKSWAMTILSATLTLAALWLFGWLWWWVGFGVVALGLAVAYQSMVITPLKKQRQPSVDRMNDMLRELRIKGVPEDALQDFICRFGGRDWEEFFEEFFPYEAMLVQRAKWSALDLKAPRRKYAAWRDPIARWLTDVEEQRRQARERRQLAKVEAARLKAIGMSDKEAQKQAEAEANSAMETLMLQAQKIEKADAKAMGLGKVPEKTFRPLPGAGWYALARLGLGLLVILLWASHFYSSALAQVPGYMVAQPYLAAVNQAWGTWGQGLTVYGLVVGCLLVFSGLSRRVLFPTLMLAGAALLLGTQPIVVLAATPELTVMTASWLGLGLMGLGTLGAVLNKLAGRPL